MSARKSAAMKLPRSGRLRVRSISAAQQLRGCGTVKGDRTSCLFSKFIRGCRFEVRNMLLHRAFAVLVLAVVVQPGLAQSQGVPTNAVVREAVRNAEDPDWPPKGRFSISQSFNERYARFNEWLWKDHGVLYVVAPTIMFQGGTQGSPDTYTASEQVNAVFGWEFLRDTVVGNSGFVIDYVHVRQLTNTTGIDFAESLGINFFTSDSVSDADAFKGLMWRQVFPAEVATLYVGQTYMANVDLGSRYAQDDTTSFISAPLSTNPVDQLPEGGMGFGLDVKLSDQWTLQAHVGDARGDGHLKHLPRMFETGEVAAVAAIMLENPFSEHGDGLYKLSGYWIDETQAGSSKARPSGWGLHLQVDQDFGDIGIFAKFGLAEKRIGKADRYVVAGVVWNKPFGFGEDRLGFGFGWVHPARSNSDNEFVTEAFYRIQMTPFLQLTPDAQFIYNPSGRPNTNFEAVFTLRARLYF
jgi:porin